MKQDGKDGNFSPVLKWVGYLTAIFSLCATIWGVGKYLYGRAETRKSLSDLFATETEQEKSRDYPSAGRRSKKPRSSTPIQPMCAPRRRSLRLLGWTPSIS